jgi:hypothetical protein
MTAAVAAEVYAEGFHPLDAPVAALSTRNIDNWSGAALGEEIVRLRRHANQIEAESARLTRRFEECNGDGDDGAPSLVSWLRHRCGLSSGAAMKRAEVARQLPELPEAQERFRKGELGLSHAAVLARVVTEVGPEAARMASDTLLEAASRLDPTRLRIVGRHLRHCVDPDGALVAALKDHERRFLHLSQTFDGVYIIDGLLDAEGGATLQTALSALSHPVPGDMRSPAERRADALVELAVRQLQGGSLPSVHGQRPHLMLTASVDALVGSPGAMPAELALAGPVHAETARRIACDASVSTVTMAGSDPLSVGREKRSIPAALRRALAHRDRGCRFPGCDRPPEWTDGHHVTHWAHGGETSIANLVLLCRVHHRRVHDEGWSLKVMPTGEVLTEPP